MRPTLQTIPGDAQRTIAGQSGTALQLSQLSTTTRNYTSSEYLATLCRKPISFSEIRKYFAQNPSAVFGTFKFSDNVFNAAVYQKSGREEQALFHNSIMFLLREGKYASYNVFTAHEAMHPVRDIMEARGLTQDDIYFTKLTVLMGDTVPEHLHDDLINALVKENLVSVELDFITQYHIYRARIGCTNRDPNYAVSLVISKIRYLQQQLHQKNMFAVGCAYYRLWMEFYLAKNMEISERESCIHLRPTVLDKNFEPLDYTEFVMLIQHGDSCAAYLINYFSAINQK